MKVLISILITIIGFNISYSQETLPIYTDYLTDNIYLIHPSAAGISDISKLRVTARKQWLDYKKAPSLQTLTFHTSLDENSAIGAAFFNDSNGHFSQIGGQISYAYHLSFDDREINQLSFGLSLLLINNSLDGRKYELVDTDVKYSLINSNYFNSDVSFAYRRKGLYTFYTVKNIAEIKNKLYDNENQNSNLRRHLLTLGYQFNSGKDFFKFEPSAMFQIVEATQEKFIDVNLKFIIPLNKSELWMGLSYRNSFNNNEIQALNSITPFLGIKFKNIVGSYSYSNQFGENTFSSAGFHQVSIGYNFIKSHYRKATWDL